MMPLVLVEVVREGCHFPPCPHPEHAIEGYEIVRKTGKRRYNLTQCFDRRVVEIVAPPTPSVLDSVS